MTACLISSFVVNLASRSVVASEYGAQKATQRTLEIAIAKKGAKLLTKFGQRVIFVLVATRHLRIGAIVIFDHIIIALFSLFLLGNIMWRSISV